jgi:hypothetical protein
MHYEPNNSLKRISNIFFRAKAKNFLYYIFFSVKIAQTNNAVWGCQFSCPKELSCRYNEFNLFQIYIDYMHLTIGIGNLRVDVTKRRSLSILFYFIVLSCLVIFSLFSSKKKKKKLYFIFKKQNNRYRIV